MKKNLFKSASLIIFILIVVFAFAPYTASAQSCLPTGRSDIPYTTTGDHFAPPCVPSSTTSTIDKAKDYKSMINVTAGVQCAGSGLGRIICQINQLLNSIIPLLIALGVVYFVWGVVQYVIRDEEEAKKKGKDRIIYGVVGLAVIVGLWGLVKIVVNTFNLEGIPAPALAPLTGAGSSCNLEGSPKFQDLACYITRIINDAIIPLLFAVATAFFVWGAVKFFIINVDDEKKRQEGKQFMLWGIIALAVMISVWGLVAILGGTFGLNTSVLPQVSP